MLNLILPVISVLLGFLIVVVLKPSQQKNLKLLLAFSGAFLLSITVLLQIILEFFSKGAEHGHVHLNKESTLFPWLLFVSLSIHSVLEGIPIEAHHNLIYGIIVHKLPVAIILSTFFIASELSKSKIAFFMVLFSLMTPLGVFLSANFEIIQAYYYELSGIVIGIFLHISTTILFESNENHKFNLTKLITIIAAVAIAYLM
mgnify:CR=1 FL=1